MDKNIQNAPAAPKPLVDKAAKTPEESERSQGSDSSVESDRVLLKKSGDIHKGHRERTLSTYLEADRPIPDHLLLEMLLYFSLPRVNTNEIAHELINRFGGLKKVLDAPISLIKDVNGVGSHSAYLIRLVLVMARRYAELDSSLSALKGVKMKKREEFADVLVPKFFTLQDERVCLMILDNQNRLITCDFISSGDLHSADMNPRVIIEKVLACRGSKIVVAHNHPSGNVEPSEADVAVTLNLRKACDIFSIELIEHLVVSNGRYSSVFDTIKTLSSVETVSEWFFKSHSDITSKEHKNGDA